MTDERLWTKFDELRNQLIAVTAERDQARAEVKRLQAQLSPPSLDPHVAASRAVGEQRRKYNRKRRLHSDSRETIE